MKEERMGEFKREYENIEIPQQLSQIVQGSIDKALFEILAEEKAKSKECVLEEFSKEQIENEKENRNVVEIDKERAKRVKMMKKRFISVAAAAVVMVGGFGFGVNASPAFAATVADVPVLGALAKIFTIERVHEETDVYVADINIPGVEGLNNPELEKKINDLVKKQVDAAVAETKKSLAEDKEAWLITGGTEEDYMEREILVDYQVNCLSEDFISFSVFKTGTMASAYEEMFHYNYDLNTGEEVTLENLLGPDYVKIANEQIKAEIAKRSQDPEAMFWDGTDGFDGFESINKDQQFYVNGKGNPVVVFNKYEIAPGAMGIQEFEIVK